MTPITCHDCGKQVDPLEVFPKGRCLACHEKHFVPSNADFQRMIDTFAGRRTRRVRR